jgi:hypothetical protein
LQHVDQRIDGAHVAHIAQRLRRRIAYRGVIVFQRADQRLQRAIPAELAQRADRRGVRGDFAVIPQQPPQRVHRQRIPRLDQRVDGGQAHRRIGLLEVVQNCL